MTSSIAQTEPVNPVDAAMGRALELARRGPVGVNPRVGCVVLDAAGRVVGQGWHRGAGTPHAEVAALAEAGRAARAGTAVVTLEPCDHTGRTGPCTSALLLAGVSRVVYGRTDPVAGGGAARLRAAGTPAEQTGDPQLRAAADELVRAWRRGLDLGRPLVTWKFAATLDGRSAATDGSSRWITGEAARRDVHDLRATCDTLLVGTGTALDDDPRLTVRHLDGTDREHQPLQAVMGLRELPPGSQLATCGATRLRTRDPASALQQLWDAGRRHVWLEGGPTLAAAFWRAGLVDSVVAYLAPALLGAGRCAVGDLGIASIDGAARLLLDDVTRIGDDVRLLLSVGERSR